MDQTVWWFNWWMVGWDGQFNELGIFQNLVLVLSILILTDFQLKLLIYEIKVIL